MSRKQERRHKGGSLTSGERKSTNKGVFHLPSFPLSLDVAAAAAVWLQR